MKDAMTPELMCLLLADARLPSGGHTQSGTLEAALAAGMAMDDIPAYLSARLHTVVPQTAAIVLHVRRAAAGVRRADNSAIGQPALTAAPLDQPALTAAPLDQPADEIAYAWKCWAAATPSEALRRNEVHLGRYYRRLIENLWDASACTLLDEAAALVSSAMKPACPTHAPSAPPTHPPRPVALGLLCALSGFDDEQSARLVGYDDVQTVTSAALKLSPMDPFLAARWTKATFSAIEIMTAKVCQIQSLREASFIAAPQIDQWAQAHARKKERLFSA